MIPPAEDNMLVILKNIKILPIKIQAVSCNVFQMNSKSVSLSTILSFSIINITLETFFFKFFSRRLTE